MSIVTKAARLPARLPGWQQLRDYRRSYLPGDLVAGLLVAALAIPQALGYAVVAGVPVQVGLYTLPPALLAYALLGSSPVLFVGPVSTVSVLSGSIVHTMAGGDPARATELTAALAITAGVVLCAAGLLRVGWVAQFLSEPIVTGFVTGLVVLIVVGEIPGLIGLPTPTGALLDRVVAIGQASPQAHHVTLAVGACALVLLFAGNRLAPRLPWSLMVLVGAIVASQTLDLPGLGVRSVGDVPTGFSLSGLPGIALTDLPDLITGGIAIAAVGIAEGLAAARTFADSSVTEAKDDNELVANGVADLAAGLAGGMAVAGSLSKTAANARAGARTQLSGVASALCVVLVIVLAAGLLAPLPRAVLSAIVIHAVWGLVHPRAFDHYRRVRRNDAVAAVVALLGVLALGPLNGLLVAIGQSLLGLVYRSVQVHVDEMGKVPGEKAAWGATRHHPERKTVPGVLVLRVDAPVFWPNSATVVERVLARVDRHQQTRVVLLDLEATNQLDITTAERLDVLLSRLRERGVDLYLVRVFKPVGLVLERTGFTQRLGEDRIWRSISAAVKAAKHAKPIGALDADGEPVEIGSDEEHIASRSRELDDDEPVEDQLAVADRRR